MKRIITWEVELQTQSWIDTLFEGYTWSQWNTIQFAAFEFVSIIHYGQKLLAPPHPRDQKWIVSTRARWFLWNVSANSHMTSVTKRNMLDPTGKVGDCSYTRHNHHPLGWIFLQGENMSFFSFLIFFRKHCLHNVLNLHQLPNGTYRCYNCVPHILPTPCTSLTYVAEKVPS